MSEFKRKPDGGLSAWIETYEAIGVGENDAEMLCLLLELRRRRENQAEAERERDELKALAEEQSKLAGRNAASAQKAEEEIARRDAAAGEAVHLYREHNPCNGMKTDWIEIDSEQLASLKESTDPETAEFRTLHDAAPPAAAGEPVAWISERNLKILGKAFSVIVKHEPVMVRPIALYTTAPPAVVSDETLRDVIRAWSAAPYPGPYVYEKMRKALGAQPPKPVAEVEELSMQIRRLVHSLKNSNPDSSLLKSVPDYMQRKGYWKATDCLRGEHD